MAMLVVACSLAGADFGSTEEYRSGLKLMLQTVQPIAAVLPACSALALGIGSGNLRAGTTFGESLRNYMREGSTWTGEYLKLHSLLAAELNIFLAAGTVIEKEGSGYYHAAYCFDPDGRLCCRQQQTHLTRFERELGLSRGEELSLFNIAATATGLVVGNDARHPETGRILALRGADLLLHCGALEDRLGCWPQVAGIWSQVQQNQLWAVEAQLYGTIADTMFGGELSVLAPCEITGDQTGYLARGIRGDRLVKADLEREQLQRIRDSYPLLKLLNPAAYRSGRRCGWL